MVRLLNMLNHCYLNVILHVMAVFPNSFFEELEDHYTLHESNSCFSCGLHCFFKQYHNRTRVIDPRDLVRLFCRLFRFEFLKFQDATEVFMKIIDWIKEDIPTLTPILTPFSIAKKMCPTCSPKDLGINDRVILGVTEANQYKNWYPDSSLADVLRNSQTDQCPSCHNTPAYVQQNFLHGPREFFIEVKWNNNFLSSDLSMFLETVREGFYLETSTSTSTPTSTPASTLYDLQSIICYRSEHYITFVKKGLYYVLFDNANKPLYFVNLNEVKEFLTQESYFPTLVIYCSDSEILEDAKDPDLNPLDSMNFTTLRKSENLNPPPYMNAQNTPPIATYNTQNIQNIQSIPIQDTPQHNFQYDFIGSAKPQRISKKRPSITNKKRKAFIKLEQFTNPAKYQKIDSCIDSIIVDDE